VLYQLALLAREMADIRQLVERGPAGSHQLNTPNIEVVQGPLQSVEAVRTLEEQCGDPEICQYLVCILNYSPEYYFCT
jgi:hypothetical protein